MSCFVIDRREFAKVAGWIAGVADNKNRFGEPAVWYWDNDAKKVILGEDWLKKMMWVYDCNAKSVAESWNEDESKIRLEHSEEEKKLFDEYRKKGKKSFGDVMEFRNAVKDYIGFVNSVLYQIEDVELSKQVGAFMNAVGMKLSEKVFGESKLWGNFEIKIVLSQ